MKKHISLLLLFIFFMAGVSLAQSKNGYVTMVVTQCFNASGGKNNIIITHGEGNPEQIDLPNLKMGFVNWSENAEAINKEMNKLKEEGYKIITSNAHSLSQGSIMVTTYVFSKD